MKIASHLRTRSTRYDRASWRVLLLLVLAVLLPTLGVLWFMNAAVRNERLLVRQRLAEAYKANLALVRDRVAASWQQRMKDVERAAGAGPASAAFGRIVADGLADAAVIRDSSAALAYPSTALVSNDVTLDQQAWDRAAELEYQRKNLAAAAKAYAGIAAASPNAHEAVRAIGAQSRCLLRAGNRMGVVQLVRQQFASPRYHRATDSTGRLIAVDQELLAVQILGVAQAGDLLTRLQNRLAYYGNPALRSGQRLFVLRELATLGVTLPALAAEELAARWAELPRAQQSAYETTLRPSAISGVWQAATPGGRVVVLHRAESLEKRLRAALAPESGSAAISVELLAPASSAAAYTETAAISDSLPGWRIGLLPADTRLQDAEADGRIAFYLWTGALVLACISLLTFLAIRAVNRQMEVARLKNDLAATVSHELKTPLASMRLLVDTLLDAEVWDPARVREYLEMISSENSRLSRLIENFLTFSRLERNKHRFSFREVSVAELVESATAAMGERLRPPACDFAAEVPESLPRVTADAESVVTVIVNLLDNACKYSDGSKRIRLRAFADGGNIGFAVEDNGIGLAPQDRKKIFDGFYQVDQQMTRRAGGCGLGLSIVRYIVGAHGGRVNVESELGRGSTFTVLLPALRS